MVGFWLFFAGVAEFMATFLAPGWRWVHAVLGVLFLFGGVAALTSPFQTFTTLAALMAIFLVIKGTFDFVVAIMARHVFDLWWLTLISGILQILLGYLGGRVTRDVRRPCSSSGSASAPSSAGLRRSPWPSK